MANSAQTCRQAARQVDKILEGARPADRSVGHPTKFVLIIDMQTAMALGLKIPHSPVARRLRDRTSRAIELLADGGSSPVTDRWRPGACVGYGSESDRMAARRSSGPSRPGTDVAFVPLNYRFSA